MKHTHGGRRFGGNLAVLFCAGLATSCVTQQEFEEARQLAKQYQKDAFDLEADNARLREANARMRSQLADGEFKYLQEASTSDLEQRLEYLQAMIDDLGRPLGDVERFDLPGGGYLYMIQDKLLFESGQSELGEEGRKALMGISREIAALDHGTLWVRGHTDSDPVKKPETVRRFPHGNLQLSAARAMAVAALLIEARDIPENEIRVMGCGSHEPVVPNDSADNKRLNRRVEIYVARPGG